MTDPELERQRIAQSDIEELKSGMERYQDVNGEMAFYDENGTIKEEA